MLSKPSSRCTLLYGFLLVLACAVTRPASAVDATAVSTGDYSRVELIALSLADDSGARAQFAIVALSEMAFSLLAETELARQQLQSTQLQSTQLQSTRFNSPQRLASLRRWIVYVERYIDELLRLSDSIDATTPVGLSAGPNGVLLLTVRGQSIMLGAPRIELQPSFEQRLSDQFCADYHCEKPVPVASVLPSASAATPPRWSFSEDAGPSCVTDDGLVLQFETMAGLGQKREFCLQLVAELRAIARAMARERDRGVVIDWQRLAVHGIPGRAQYQLDLNQSGDSLQLAIPHSAAIPGFLAQAQDWLRARSGSRQHTLVLDNAETIYQR